MTLKKMIVFRRFFFSYLLILIIPIIIGSSLYLSAAKTVKRQSIQLQHVRQEKTVLLMDNYISRSNDIALQFLFDNDINALGKVNAANMSESDIVAFLNARKRIASYAINSTFNQNFYILFPENGVVLDKDIINSSMKFFYNNILSYSSMSYDEWHEKIINSRERTVWPSEAVNKKGTVQNMVTYLQPLDISFFSSGAVIAFLFDEMNIELALGVQGDSDISVCIMDQENQFIYHKGDVIPEQLVQEINGLHGESSGFYEKNFGNGNMLAVYTVSGLNGWKYISLIPSNIALDEVAAIRNITIFIVLAILIMGVIAVYYISYKNSFPIQKLFSLLDENDTFTPSQKKTYMMLENGVGNLISTNQTMRKSFEQQAQILNALYVERVLNGNGVIEQDVLAYCMKNLNGFQISGIYVSVILIKTKGPLLHTEGVKLLCDSVLERMENRIQAHLVHMLKDDEFAIVLGNSDTADLRITENHFIEQIRYHLDHENTEYLIGVGAYYNDIAGIRYSYRMALFALQYAASFEMDKNVVYSDSITPTDTFLYSPQVEQQLIGTVKSGNTDNVETILNDIYTRNFKENTLLPHMMKCLLYNLYCTFLKISNPLNVSALGGGYVDDGFIDCLEHNNEDFRIVFKEISEALIALSQQYKNSKRSHNVSLKDCILEYIAQNYQNSVLDTVIVAAKFNITEGYLSQFFKEQTGFSFSTYLTNYRMERACELLSNSDINIADIAESTGYGNVHSFRRAFKRVLGMTPTEYRDSGELPLHKPAVSS